MWQKSKADLSRDSRIDLSEHTHPLRAGLYSKQKIRSILNWYILVKEGNKEKERGDDK